jgi:hypothetical protein
VAAGWGCDRTTDACSVADAGTTTDPMRFFSQLDGLPLTDARLAQLDGRIQADIDTGTPGYREDASIDRLARWAD